MSVLYKDSEVVGSFLKEEFDKLLVNQRMVFMDTITVAPRDNRILETWKTHFREVGSPFVVVKRGERRILIKELKT